MIDGVEGGRQIELRQRREIAGVERHDYVCEHLEDRNFGRVVSSLGGLKVRNRSLERRYSNSCLATTRSSSFETTDKFEIGRNDFTSDGSRTAVLSSDVT